MRSSTTLKTRLTPYFETPRSRGRWLTTISVIRPPCQLAKIGTKRCNSPYSRTPESTSRRYAFSVQP